MRKTSIMVPQRESPEASSICDLVRAAQAGDREAFGQLFERFQRSVLAVCRRRARNEAEAQELCQDVFVQALRKIRHLRQPAAFGGWLRSIANRLAINAFLRKAPVATSALEVLDGADREDASPLDDMLRAERRDRLRAGLRRLKELDRQTLVEFYVNGRSLVEMSASFDAPLGTIKRRLHVARLRLAAEVEPASNRKGLGQDFLVGFSA